MRTTTKQIVFVRKDATTLAPGASLLIKFLPSSGPAVFSTRMMVSPDDVITGSRPLIFETGIDGEFLVERRNPGLIMSNAVPFGLNLGTGAGGISIVDDVLVGHGPGFPPPPPPEPDPAVRLEVFRGADPTPKLSKDFAFKDPPVRSARLDIVEPLQPVGVAGQQWTAKFTNILDKPILCHGKVLFREMRRLEATTLPLQLLRRLMGQAVAGLEPHIELNDSTVKLEFAREASSLFDLPSLTKDFGFDVFNDVRIANTRVELDHGIPPDKPDEGRVPLLRLHIEMEQEDPEISIDLGVTNVDINISSMRFTLNLYLTNKIFSLAGNGRLRGDFPWVPFIKTLGTVDTDIRFSSSALGVVRESINTLLDVVDVVAFISTFGKARIKSRIPTLAGALTKLGEQLVDDHWLSISNALQVAIQAITNRDFEFHGIESVGDDWEVISGPLPPFELPLPRPGFEPRPAADTTPMDGPQPASELQDLQRINHIVVLMMENRSYDHVLGHHTHPGHGANPEYDGLTGDEVNRITNVQPDARPNPTPTTKFFPSPPHDFNSVMGQIDGGSMSGFGEQFKQALERKNLAMDARSIMNFHVRGQLRNYDRAASEFAVSKRWFAAHPGPTWPNRLCAISGGTPFLDNSDIPEQDLGYLDVTTIFDLLDAADINWRYYEHDIAFLRMVDRYRLEADRIRPFELFAEDARAGLPAVTYIDPNFVDVPSGGVVNDDHPGGSDMIDGQTLVADVINALMQSPGWNNTLLVITYDEHGGFFDHVPPPGSSESPIGGVRKVNTDGPEMLGVRVPAFIISPRAERGAILDRVYDHTSILKSILTRFVPGQEHRLGRRTELAAHLGGAVPLATPRQGFTPYTRLPASDPASTRSVIEAGSFHDHMRSVGNFMRLPAERIRAMIPNP